MTKLIPIGTYVMARYQNLDHDTVKVQGHVIKQDPSDMHYTYRIKVVCPEHLRNTELWVSRTAVAKQSYLKEYFNG